MLFKHEIRVPEVQKWLKNLFSAKLKKIFFFRFLTIRGDQAKKANFSKKIFFSTFCIKCIFLTEKHKFERIMVKKILTVGISPVTAVLPVGHRNFKGEVRFLATIFFEIFFIILT